MKKKNKRKLNGKGKKAIQHPESILSQFHRKFPKWEDFDKRYYQWYTGVMSWPELIKG